MRFQRNNVSRSKSSVEDRAYNIDSGPSPHMIGRTSLTPEETSVIMTANGTVEASGEATVYIKDLDMFSCVKLVEYFPMFTVIVRH